MELTHYIEIILIENLLEKKTLHIENFFIVKIIN